MNGETTASQPQPLDAWFLDLIACVSAVGLAFDPVFLVPGVNRRANFNLASFPDGQQISTGSGWITERAFIEWCRIFVEASKDFRGQTLWSILLLDGHHTHTSCPDALQILNENRILAVCMPSHTTSCLQPLDVSVFGPLKSAFQRSLHEWKISKHPKITIDDLPTILSSGWDSSLTTTNIKSGFRKTGVWPLNMGWVQENMDMINSLNPSNLSIFESMLQRARRTKQNDKELLKSCDYLDLAYYPDEVLANSKPHDFGNLLGEILDHVTTERKQVEATSTTNTKKRVNRIGESVSQPKVLNFMERIEALHESRQRESNKKGKDLHGEKTKRSSDNLDDSLDRERIAK